MSSRRKFLVRGSLATTALLAAGPLKTIASVHSSLDKFQKKSRTLVLLHTNDLITTGHPALAEVMRIRKESNLLLLHAGQLSTQDSPLPFDAEIEKNSLRTLLLNDYRILQKGAVKIGVIYAVAGEPDVIQKVQEQSGYLKNVKNCNLVICLSQLGHKNNNSMDDVSLASASSDLDVIIGGHPKNFHKLPVVIRNRKKSEVIIHSAASYTSGFGRIEMVFDEHGKKNHINFTRFMKNA